MIDLIKSLVMVAAIFLMLGVGMSTTFGQLVDVIKQLPPLLRGILANFVVIPVLFYLSLQWSTLTPEVAIGFMIMAAAPVAPMAPAFVGMAKGDVTYSVGLMTIVAVLCVPITPLILSLGVSTGEQGLSLDTLKIVQVILTVQLIPITAGMVLNHLRPAWTEKLLRFVPRIGQIGLAIAIVLIVVVGAKQFAGLGLLTLLAILLAVIVCLLLGDWMMVGETAGRRRALGVSTAIRNPALGLLIATGNFQGTDAVPVVLVFAVLSMIVGLAYGKLMAPKEAGS